MFSDLLQYKRESFWEQHRIIRFDTLTAQAEYTVMAVFRGEAEDLFAYYQFSDAETPQPANINKAETISSNNNLRFITPLNLPT